jgi:hypothetical protein
MMALAKKFYWIPLLIVALAGLAVDLYLTRNGAGITGDGVWYVQGAENILGGHGYSLQRADGFIPITLFHLYIQSCWPAWASSADRFIPSAVFWVRCCWL